MPRTPTTVRLSRAERRLLESAADLRGEGVTTYMREGALEKAVEELEEQADIAQAEGGEDRERQEMMS